MPVLPVENTRQPIGELEFIPLGGTLPLSKLQQSQEEASGRSGTPARENG